MEYIDKILLALQIFIAVGVVILVHELGHFLMARYMGVRVDKFSLGFGPRLFGFKRGDTDYMVCLFFFFGGYVKMAGEDPENRQKFEKWEYFGQPWWSRALIVFAGPFMNFVFAYVVFVLLMSFAIKVPDYTTRIGGVEKNSIAEKAGLKYKDEILSVNGKEVKSWSDFVKKFDNEKNNVLKVTDGGKKRVFKIKYSESGIPGVSSSELPVIESVSSEIDGFEKGDEILKIDGVAIKQFTDIEKAFIASAGKEILFEVKRGKEILTRKVKPMKDAVFTNECILKINGAVVSQFADIGKATITSEGKEMLFEIKREKNKEVITRKVKPMKDAIVTNKYIIGISSKAPLSSYEKVNFFKSLGLAGVQVYSISKLQLVAISKLVTGKMSARESLGGPVMIVQSAANMAKKGMNDFIFFFAFISVALGLFNLIIPIPVVDCGVLILFILEGIRGKPVSFKVQSFLAQAGFFLLIALAVLVTWRDIAATISQIKEVEKAGCDIIRVAVPDEESAKALKKIKKGIKIPLVADIHFNYKLALMSIDSGADKIRINPGNIGEEWKVKEILAAAKSAKIPIRIGLNAGSIEKYTGRKRHEKAPVMAGKLVSKAMEYVRLFEKNRFYDMVISLKASDTMMTVEAYRKMAKLCDYPFHLGVTEAGTAITGTVKSSVGIGLMLNEGLGDTLRVSLAAEPKEEIKVGREILKTLGLRKNESDLIVCPTCGRCEVDIFGMAKKVEDEMLKLKKPVKVAVMGCVVNGPGEASEADLGLAGGKKSGLIFKNGKIIKKVPEKYLLKEFIKELRKIGQV